MPTVSSSESSSTWTSSRAPGHFAEVSRGGVEKSGKEHFRQTHSRAIHEQRRIALRELRKVVEQPGISVDDLVDHIDSEHRLRDQKLEGHVLVESLQRTALRRLEDEVRGHKPRGDGPSAEVVNRLGT